MDSHYLRHSSDTWSVVVLPVLESEFLPPQRGQETGWGEEVEMEEPHMQAAPVAFLPPALSVRP